MKRKFKLLNVILLFILLPGICFAQAFSEESLQGSSDNSLQGSSEESIQGSSENSTQASNNSSENSAQAISGVDASSSTLIIGGIVVATGLIIGGLILTAAVSNAKEEEVVGLQDQIYLAQGKEYAKILSFFEIGERDLIKANDELVIEGFQVDSDLGAVGYLSALFAKLIEKTDKFARLELL